MDIIAEFNEISKNYGSIAALQSFSMTVAKGQSAAILGPNGAGKSTALEILQGLRKPTAGNAVLFGHPAGSIEALRHIGVTPQLADFPPQITPIELLQLASAHYEKPRQIEEIVEIFKLGKTADRRMTGFSGGEKRRVALALCFVGDPDLVILDEPTTGLDADGQQHFQEIAKTFLEEGGSIILTSHYWPEIENIADTITLIDSGSIIMNGSIADIKAAVGLSRISISCEQPGKFVKSHFEKHGSNWIANSNHADDVVRELINSGEQFCDICVGPIALEEALGIYRAVWEPKKESTL